MGKKKVRGSKRRRRKPRIQLATGRAKAALERNRRRIESGATKSHKRPEKGTLKVPKPRLP